MKTMISYLKPYNMFTTLDIIDAQSPSYTLNRQDSNRRVFGVLFCVSLCLLGIHYLKYSYVFKEALSYLSLIFNNSSNKLQYLLQKEGMLSLASYTWWTGWHIIGYVLVPYLFIKYGLKTNFLSMGWRFNDTRKHAFSYLLLLSPVLIFVFITSFGSEFVNHYPFYKLAGRSWFDLLIWELLYLTQFICLEFFFRGFMLNALRPAIGSNAVWVMCVPYMMIHLPKLWLEAMGAILFGLFLGILAIRSRSIWGGVAVHAGVALAMDFTALIKQNNIPTQLLPW